jgi:NADH-quinone oxidoreductase subunit H
MDWLVVVDSLTYAMLVVVLTVSAFVCFYSLDYKAEVPHLFFFIITSVLGLLSSLLPGLFIPINFVEIPHINTTALISYGILIIFAISSLSAYSIILAGWSSNSKYAFIGSLRSAAQMISYEVSLGLSILPVALMSNSFSFSEIVLTQARYGWFCFSLFPLMVIFFISMLAETNRTPFDLVEAEAELVAGYHVEYSSIYFALFFLSEYGNMIVTSALISILFFGGWAVPGGFSMSPLFVMVSKTLFFCFLFILVRATFPRYRYDQLMEIGWKVFLLVVTMYLIVIAGFLLTGTLASNVLFVTSLRVW